MTTPQTRVGLLCSPPSLSALGLAGIFSGDAAFDPAAVYHPFPVLGFLRMNTGILYAALAYVAWGLFPLYFKQVADVPSLEVVMHRTLWSLVVVLGLLAVRRQWAWMASVVRQPRVLGAFALSAVLLSGNWLTYVWAVQNHHVVDASLGYFILPLVNVALGFVFLRERPRPGNGWPWR